MPTGDVGAMTDLRGGQPQADQMDGGRPAAAQDGS